MNIFDDIKVELKLLTDEKQDLLKLSSKLDDTIKFGTKYQKWYSRAIKIIELLGKDRADEFKSYYSVDPRRKSYDVSTYVIQDYVKAIGAAQDYMDRPKWDVNNLVAIRIMNQFQILESLESRINSVLQDVEGKIQSELQVEELNECKKLIKVNVRAAGSLAGVILERHLQRVAINHNVKVTKKNPTIADLNDPIKNAGVYDVPIWRKIQYYADIRNLCSHQKDKEPTKELVDDLIDGVNYCIKTIF
jgi:hypothetical protein